MHRLRKNIWRLRLHVQKLINIYMTEPWLQYIHITNLWKQSQEDVAGSTKTVTIHATEATKI